MHRPSTPNAVTTILTTIAALHLIVTDAIDDRTGGKDRRDRGSSVEQILLIAGFVALAVLIVAGIGVVVNRYLSRVQ